VSNGSVLPRESGVSDKPLASKTGSPPVVTFVSPPSLELEITLPNSGKERSQSFGVACNMSRLMIFRCFCRPFERHGDQKRSNFDCWWRISW
jgi:hypothetical protein